MSKLDDQITEIKGNDVDILRHVFGLPAGQSVASAKLTVKVAPGGADDTVKVFQKSITTTYVAGQGQVKPDVSFTLTASAQVKVGDTKVLLQAPLPVALAKDMVLIFSSGEAVRLTQDAPKYSHTLVIEAASGAIAASETCTLTATPLLFELTPANTVLFTTDESAMQYFDIPILTSAGKRGTPFMGRVLGIEQVTVEA